MRISMQNGRVGMARHLDRDFDISMAEHIDASKSTDNVTVSWMGVSSEGFEKDELVYYEYKFGKALGEKNDRYVRQRHPERCKTLDDLLHDRQTRPEEEILQIGNIHDGISNEDFYAITMQYIKELEKWNNEHGCPFKILDYAFHFDEASPHLHLRRVWQYRDEKDGLWKIGQDKALERAGIELPNPDKPKSQHNNRKMTFDKIWRARYQEIAMEYGLQIETEPLAKRRNLKKAIYIDQETQRLEETYKKILQAIVNGETKIQNIKQEIREIKQIKDSMPLTSSETLRLQNKRLNDELEWEKSKVEQWRSTCLKYEKQLGISNQKQEFDFGIKF